MRKMSQEVISYEPGGLVKKAQKVLRRHCTKPFGGEGELVWNDNGKHH